MENKLIKTESVFACMSLFIAMSGAVAVNGASVNMVSVPAVFIPRKNYSNPDNNNEPLEPIGVLVPSDSVFANRATRRAQKFGHSIKDFSIKAQKHL